MGDRFPGSIHDLALLTAAAFELSNKAAGRPVAEPRVQYACHTFVAVCLTADGILRLHPERGFYCAAGNQDVWHVTAIAALSRVLMEACVHLHYFSLDDVTEDEREFRFICAELHRVRERLEMCRIMRLERQALEARGREQPAPGQASCRPLELQGMRDALPVELEALRERLLRNRYFQQLAERDKKQWLCGRYGRSGEYRGSGFAFPRKTRASRAGLSAAGYEAEYRHLSGHVHTAPHAVNQIAAFRADDPQARALLIDVPIRSCCGYLALAMRHFLALFPELKETLPAEVHELVEECVVYATGEAS